MDALRIKNLRCLTDTGRVPLRPITLLVGRNSSGKSTFLRAFPLLRQSVETPRESPILWYHERFVDFGSFQEAVNERAKERAITFEFEVPIESWQIELPSCLVAMTLGERDGGGVFIQSYRISAFGHHVDIDLGPDGGVRRLRVDDAMLDLRETCLQLSGSAFLMPMIARPNKEPVVYQKHYKRPKEEVGEEEILEPLFFGDPSFREPLTSATRPLLRGDVPPLFLDDLPVYIKLTPLERAAESLRASLSHESWGEFVVPEQITTGLSALLPLLLADRASSIIKSADNLVADFFAHVAYLAPLRATATRGYRIQDLSVSEVDPRGENLAMFLRSLSAEELESFADFTRRHLDFDASLRVFGLHADILVREAPRGRAKNLVDVGSGYAQVLPLAAILWSTCVRKPRRENGHTSLLAIEQPELHLHPAHQARLTRMFAGAMLESRKAGRPVKLLIETHSEALVNGFGDLVHEKLLSPEDVQIAIFDQDEETHDTTVHLSDYDEDGALRNWPYGFFNPIDDHREAAE